jgi:hypothetical protein
MLVLSSIDSSLDFALPTFNEWKAMSTLILVDSAS